MLDRAAYDGGELVLFSWSGAASDAKPAGAARPGQPSAHLLWFARPVVDPVD
jgi:hypothetical protein